MSTSDTLTMEEESRTRSGQNFQTTNLYVSFWVAGQLLGVPVHFVQEVLSGQTIARTPRARPEVAGLLNLRGQIVTAVNLRKRLGLPPLEDGRQSMNVVVRHQGDSYSLLVDEVGEVINVSPDGLKTVPPTLDRCWKQVVTGVFRLEERLFLILDVAVLLNFGS